MTMLVKTLIKNVFVTCSQENIKNNINFAVFGGGV